MTAMKRACALVTVMLAVGVVATPAAAKNVGIKIKDNVFDKHYRVILEGDTITWTNAGDNEHTVTPYDGTFPASGASRNCVPNPIIGNDPDDCMDPGDTHTVKFSTSGVYEYYCAAHGNRNVRPDPEKAKDEQPCGMCGIIEVKADEQTAPTVAPTPTQTRRASSPSPSPSASESPSASPSASPGEDDGSGDGTVAAGGRSGDDGGGLGRGAIALLAIVGLSGAGWWTWKKYLATS